MITLPRVICAEEESNLGTSCCMHKMVFVVVCNKGNSKYES